MKIQEDRESEGDLTNRKLQKLEDNITETLQMFFNKINARWSGTFDYNSRQEMLMLAKIRIVAMGSISN